MVDLDWLTARPIAHRGLHDAASGTVENTPGAVSAALERDYAIEVDLQITADGEAVVFHDDMLERLTHGHGAVAAHTTAELKDIELRGTSDRIQTLAELLDQVRGRAGLVLELKSLWNGDTVLARRVVAMLDGYIGPVAVMSFDPSLIEAVRRLNRDIIRGIVAERFRRKDWPQLPFWRRCTLSVVAHFNQTRPHFISYDIKGLSSLEAWFVRRHGVPMITWTVRSEADAAYARRWADQITFEGFLPEVNESMASRQNLPTGPG